MSRPTQILLHMATMCYNLLHHRDIHLEFHIKGILRAIMDM
jgi:hypothetical protein